MKTKAVFRSLMIASLLSGLLSGCVQATPDPKEECKECEKCIECEICLYSSDLALPQIFYMTKANYVQADLDMIQAKVINPLVAYFDAKGSTVVSISIDNNNRGGSVKNEFTVEVIISNNDGNHDPITMSFVTTKVSGELPLWVMESE